MSAVHGLLPATITPFTSTGHPHWEEVARLATWLLDRGLNGFFVAGTTGEGLLLEESDRKRLLEVYFQTAKGRGQVVAHIGAHATATAVRLAEHACVLGVDAVALMPPMTFSQNSDGLRHHFAQVHRVTAGTGMPLFAYDLPGITGFPLTISLVRMLRDEFGIAGLKFSRDHLLLEHRLARVLGGDFRVMHGLDETLLFGLSMGALGGVGGTYQLAPSTYARILALHQQQAYAEALPLQHQCAQMVAVIQEHAPTQFVGMMKGLMGKVGFQSGPTAGPQAPLAAEVVDRCWQDLHQAGLGPILEGPAIRQP